MGKRERHHWHRSPSTNPLNGRIISVPYEADEFHVEPCDLRFADVMLEIYRPYVEKTAVSFELEVPTEEEPIKHYEERQAELIKDKLNLKEEDPHRYNNHIDKALEAITNISRCRGMIISHTPPCDCPPPIPVLLPLPERVPDLTPCQKIALWVPFSDETLWAVQRGCLCVAAGAIGAAAVGSVPAVIGGLAGSSLPASRMLQAAW